LFSGLESADFVNKILYESCFLVALHKVEFSVDDDYLVEKMRLLSSALKVWVTTVLTFFQRMCRFL